jgi:hypothetical protein
VLGQGLRATPAQASVEYSRLIAEVAESHDVDYLPLHERQVEEIKQRTPPRSRTRN